MRRSTSRGFTLLEVMIGLALMGLALTVLIKSAAGSIFNSEEAHMMGVVTDLARGKMYDIEEILLKDGFTDTSQSHESPECFTDEGWPNICYSYKVEEPKVPTLEELQAMALKKAQKDAGKMLGSAGSAAGGLGSNFTGSAGDALAALGSDAGALGGLENSMLGGMLGQMGMTGLDSGVEGAAAGSMISQMYTQFQEVLKVAVRKVTLTMTWTVLGSKRDMKVIAYFTDPLALNKTMLGQMTNLAEMMGGGSDSGSGSGSGTSSSSTGNSRGSRGSRGGGK